MSTSATASGNGRTTDHPLQASLEELGRQIYKRRKQDPRSLREITSRANISPAFLTILEKARNPKTRKASQPSFEVIVRLADVLAGDAPTRGEWIRLAGYEPPSPTAPTAPIPLGESSLRATKPALFVDLELMEDDLVGYLQAQTVAEVPSWVALKGLGPDSDVVIVGVSLVAAARTASLYALKGHVEEHRPTEDPSGLGKKWNGKRIGVYGRLTTATFLLLLYAEKAGLDTRMTSFGGRTVDPGTGQEREPGSSDALEVVLAYSSGALTHMLRAGDIDLALIPTHPYIALRRDLLEHCTAIDFNPASWLSQAGFPVALMATLRRYLRDDRRTYVADRLETAREIAHRARREQIRIATELARQAARPEPGTLASAAGRAIELDLQLAFPSDVYVNEPLDLADKLSTLSENGKRVGMSEYRAASEIRRSIVSAAEFAEARPANRKRAGPGRPPLAERPTGQRPS